MDQLRQGEHILAAGTTGSGKTVLAQRLLSSTEYVIVIDTKHELNWKGFDKTADPDDCFIIDKHRDGHTIFRPKNLKDVERVMARAYAEWGWSVYVDEVLQIGAPGRSGPTAYPPSYTRILTAGRSRAVTMWSSAQRPKYFPLFAITESSNFFIFELGSADDRKDLHRMVGIEAISDAAQETIRPHEFLYFNRKTKLAVRSKLNLNR